MRQLYHLTETKNIASILEKGIIPAYTQGLTLRPCLEFLPPDDFRRTNVWLTDNPEHIMQTQASERRHYSFLAVDCSSLKINLYKVHEFLYQGVISSSLLGEHKSIILQIV